MNPTPIMIAVQPAALALRGSPRPSACPTRTAAADETPNGTMNVNAAMFSAI